MGSFGIPLFPEQASTFARDIDALYLFILAVSAFFALAVSVAVVVFGIVYRRRHAGEVGARIEGNLPLELLWSIIPTMISMVMFGWGASSYFHMRTPPAEALQIYAVGKQWMWKFQHLEGQREINELHVPVNRPVKVTITSEDVLHSLFFPSFRTKMDAIPGRYTQLWFEATKVGEYHIFCTEYCGTNHSGMIGKVVVMEPSEYQAWLAGGGVEGTLVERGGRLFQDLACNTCHLDTGKGRGPSLNDIVGKTVELADGTTTVVDEGYLRESIINSQAKIVRGYQPLMPGVFIAPYAYCYRCPQAEANPEKFGFEKDCNWTLEELDFILHSQTAPGETAAMLVEPVLGEGGYIIPPKRFLQGLRKMCDEHGILLIADEIQCGFGRTGRYFAVEHFGITPDILIMAKGLASGMPLSAVASTSQIMNQAPPGSHGGTYGGNAVACAAAAASIKIYQEEKLLENAARLGKTLLARLQEFKEEFPGIGDVRGLGLMAGVEFVKPGGKTPDKEKATAVRNACIKNGLLILTCGTYDNIIRWIPPLIITAEQLEEGLKIFKSSLEKTA